MFGFPIFGRALQRRQPRGAEYGASKGWNDTNSFAFWHAPTNRLILKPKDKGACWSRGDGHLFMWADAPLLDDGRSPSSTPLISL